MLLFLKTNALHHPGGYTGLRQESCSDVHLRGRVRFGPRSKVTLSPGSMRLSLLPVPPQSLEYQRTWPRLLLSKILPLRRRRPSKPGLVTSGASLLFSGPWCAPYARLPDNKSFALCGPGGSTRPPSGCPTIGYHESPVPAGNKVFVGERRNVCATGDKHGKLNRFAGPQNLFAPQHSIPGPTFGAPRGNKNVGFVTKGPDQQKRG